MNGDNDTRIAELEKQIESLKALLDGEIARAANERKENIDKRIEYLGLIKSVNDNLGKDIGFAEQQIQINRDDLNRAYEIFGLIETRLKLLEKTEDWAKKSLKEVMREQLRVRREMMRYDDAYYHVFPERLAQDVRLLNQLGALTSRPDPDADPEKE
jgi:hypothetical protein